MSSTQEQGQIEAVRLIVKQLEGSRLPAERDLSEHLKISRPKLRTILSKLRDEGLVESRMGSGTYAVLQSDHRLSTVAILIDAKLKLGDDPFYTHLVEQLQRELQNRRIRTVMERFSEDAIEGDFTAPADGYVLLGLAASAVLTNRRSDSAPTVALLLGAQSEPQRRTSVIHLEDRTAGSRAAKMLIEEDGCTNILFFGRDDIPASRERFQGTAEQCEKSGVAARFVETRLNYAAGVAAGQDLVVNELAPETGIISTNDWLAVGLRVGLSHHSNSAFRRLPIISFDGLPLTADPTLRIKSLKVPLEQIARDAVSEILRLARSPISIGRSISYPLLDP